MSELTFVQRIALNILRDWIDKHFVHRSAISEYTSWMHEDPEFMRDMQKFFDNSTFSRGSCNQNVHERLVKIKIRILAIQSGRIKPKLRPMPIPQPTNVGKGYWP